MILRNMHFRISFQEDTNLKSRTHFTMKTSFQKSLLFFNLIFTFTFELLIVVEATHLRSL
jgi:hypothetical protein